MRALHSEQGGMTTDFLKMRTLKYESEPQVLRGGLLTLHPLPNEAGSAAARSAFFAQRRRRIRTARALHAEPGGVPANFQKKRTSKKKMGDLGWLEAG